MANDILDEMIARTRAANMANQDKDKWVIANLVNLRELGCDDDGRAALARAKWFWFDLPEKQAVQRAAKDIKLADSFDDVFRREFGIGLHEFALVVIVAGAFFLRQGKGDPSLLRADEYFGSVDAVETARKALSLIALRPDELAVSLLSSPRQSWAIDFTPLRKWPIVEVFPGQFACVDVFLLGRVLTEGVFHRLVEAYGEHKSKFRQLFGDVFAEYLHTLMEQFSYVGHVLAKEYFRSPKFADTEAEVCDGLLVRQDTALLMEYKSGLLTPRTKYSGIPEELFSGIRKLFARDDGPKKRKGTGQLAQSLKRIIEGARIVSGDAGQSEEIDLGSRQLLPTIVLYEEGLDVHAVRNYAEERFTESLGTAGVDRAEFGPLLVLSLRDIETLESLTSKASVDDVFSGYARLLGTNPEDRLGSFHDYLYREYGHLKTETPSFVQRAAVDLFDWAKVELQRRAAK